MRNMVVLWQLWRPQMVKDVDRMISAKLPNPKTNRLAHETVAKCMMHGPCGVAWSMWSCISKFPMHGRYPHKFQSKTMTNVNKYPIYQRTNTRCIDLVHGVELDNRWVVPHNVYLSTKYDAHIKYTYTCALGTRFKLIIIQLKCTLHEQTYVWIDEMFCS
jgi:hypothetical protein